MSPFVFSSIYLVDDNFPATCEPAGGAIVVSDLSDAIAAAAVDASTPHTIRVCAGTYNEAATMFIDSADLVGLTIVGALQGAETNLDVNIVGTTADIFNVRVDGVTFRDFETTAGRFAFVNTTTGTNLTLESITINDTTNDSIRLNAIGVVLTNVTINNAGNGVRAMADGIQANASSGDFTVTNLSVNTTRNYCVRMRGSGPNIFNTINLSDCLTYGLVIEPNGDDITIDDFTVDTTGTRDCILLQGDDITLSNVLLDNCGRRGLYVSINGGGTLLNVSDVTVNNAATVGIDLRNANAANPGDIVIDDLLVDGSGGIGMIFNNITNGQITDLSSTNSTSHGVQVRNGNFSSYSAVSLAKNIIQDSAANGLHVSNNANNNTFNDFLIQDSTGDGIQANNTKRNTYTDITISVDDGTNGDGVVITNNGNRNTFDNVNVDNVSGDCVRLDDGNILNYRNSNLENCGDFGFDASPTTEAILFIENIDISNTDNDGILVQNFIAGNVRVRDVTITDSADRGISIVNSSGVVLQDFIITRALSDGLVLSNADNNTISTSLLTNNIITDTGDATNDNGLEFIAGSDGNAITNLNVINSFDDGIRISTSLNNNFTNVAITNPAANADDGISLNGTATGNSFIDLSIDATDDDCFDTRADNTTVTNGSFTNCTDMGFLANVVSGTTLNLNTINVVESGDDSILIQNFTAGAGIVVNDVTVLNSGDIGMHINTVDGGSYADLNIQGSTRFGLLLQNADNTTIGVTSLVENIISGNEDGVQLQTGSDGNTLSDFIISNSNDEGLIIANSNNNVFADSRVNENGDIGILLNDSATGNAISNNLFLENANYGARIFNTAISANNTFFNNCFRNVINADNNESDATNNFDNGVAGNFWGSLPVDGTGFSESCVDDRTVDDDICDAAFNVPGGGNSTDNFPLQKCERFTPALEVTKTSAPINDHVNIINHKSIPGAEVRYTVTVTNAATLLTGMAEDVIVNDDLNDEITTNGSIIWKTNSIQRTSPDYDGGITTPLTDALADDDADFDNSVGNRTVNAVCGDINAGEMCTITYDVFVN